MTDLLYMSDSYLREFDAVVTGVTDNGQLIVDQTAFYAGGGGQPCDIGKLTAGDSSWQVTKVGKADGEIVHTIEGGDPPAVGSTVHGELNWEHRYRLMRTHTALHVLCGTEERTRNRQVPHLLR